MPQYLYLCERCGHEHVDTRGMNDPEPQFRCVSCADEGLDQLIMKRNYVKEGTNVGIHEYAKPLESHSLAIHPDQIPEHRREHPEIDVRRDGVILFRDTQQHDKYLKKIGWEKRPQKRNRRGKAKLLAE